MVENDAPVLTRFCCLIVLSFLKVRDIHIFQDNYYKGSLSLFIGKIYQLLILIGYGISHIVDFINIFITKP